VKQRFESLAGARLTGTWYMHVFAAGRVWLKLALLPSGNVAGARVMKSALQPIGQFADCDELRAQRSNPLIAAMQLRQLPTLGLLWA
jgi:hypothetical protein